MAMLVPVLQGETCGLLPRIPKTLRFASLQNLMDDFVLFPPESLLACTTENIRKSRPLGQI